MKKTNLDKKKIIASVLCANMLLMNVPGGVLASEISGIAPTGNTYNIEAAKVSGDTGFRHYDKFDLTQGDIANLIYKDGYSKFVNLVNNQININGIVNTMKGNNFYNGHAIFLSPNGIVVGASGVLNVGSLSLLTPSQSKFNSFKSAYESGNLSAYEFGADSYKGLITDSHGNIVINGKILARGDVNVYGDNVTIQGTSTDKAGIISGWNDTNSLITSENQAQTIFNNLVSNNITDTTNFALQNGKIKIVAGFKEYTGEGANKKPDGTAEKAEVNIKNAQIGGNEVDIQANSTREYGMLSLADAGDLVSSKIDITDSNISGAGVNITANSEAKMSKNLNTTVPTVFLWLFDSDTHLDGYFTNDVYNGFEGVRTSAIVNVANSQIKSTGDLSIESQASSNTGVNSDWVSEAVPHIFYGYGTKTESKVNITGGSIIKATGDVDISASSENVLKAVLRNDTVGVNLNLNNAYDLAFMKNSAIADTKVLIENSTVEGDYVTAQALAYNEMDNRVILNTRIGRNDFADNVGNKGGSSASMAALLNATDINSSVEVKNSTITATQDATLRAYNINDVSNWVDAEVTDPLAYTTKWEEGSSAFTRGLDRLGRFATAYDQASHLTLGDVVNKFTSKGKAIYEQVWPEDKQVLSNASIQGGLGVVWNNTQTTNNVIINNSTINAQNIRIKAHTVDAVANEADAYAEETANWGGAFALDVNKQTNNNKVDIINGSTLTAQNYLAVDSIVEQPAQRGFFGISTAGLFGVNLNLGFNFGFNANDDWTFAFHEVGSNPESEKLLPEAGILGFYNNFVVGSSAGEKASVSGAVIYSQIENNSDINITDSTLTTKGEDVLLNSVVSASAHDASDFFNYNGLIDEIKSLAKKEFNKWNHESGSGAGGAVLVQDFTQNARITVDNSTLSAADDLELNSAAEQSYLNLVTPGGKAETIGITGAVSVQKVHGTTGTTVKNSSKLSADAISIDSGKAKACFTEKGTDTSKAGIEYLKDDMPGMFHLPGIADDGEDVYLADEREAKDHITALAFTGSLTKQSEESNTQPTSQGAAIGASVVVQNIDRVVQSYVEDSTLTANSINVKSDSYTRNVFLTAAGSFAGGVSPDRNTQAQANAGADNGHQQMPNVGNWMDILDNAREDEEDVLGLQNLFNENNPNQQGADNARQNVNNINQQNAQVNNNGGINNNAGGNNPGNHEGNFVNNDANPQNAVSNFSLAAAGSVSVVYDESAVITEIKNSTLNVGQELTVDADRDHFMLNVTGGVAKSGTVGGGAAVSVYTVEDYSHTFKDKNNQDYTVYRPGVSSVVDNSKILFTSDYENKQVNIIANDEYYTVNVGVGVGISGGGNTGGDSQKFDAAIGGSFNTNRLLGTAEAKIINGSEIKNDFKKDAEGNLTDKIYTNDIDVNVYATGDTTIWNLGGDAGIATGGSSEKFQLGAAVAGNMDFLEQKIHSEIKGSKLANVTNVDMKSELDQNINSISVAGAVTQRSDYSFNLEGALGLEFIKNNVTALIDSSEISSSGYVNLLADSDIEGRTLTGDVNLQAGKGIGVGIGVVLGIDNSTVSSEIKNGSKITKSNSIEVNANSKDDRDFLAVNLGLSDEASEILTNGVVNIYKTNVESIVSGNSNLSSAGAVQLLSNYKNVNEGVTAVAEKTKNGTAFGANILGSYYGNTVKSELEKGSNILSSGSVKIDATASEEINYIPAALVVSSSGGSAVGADVVVNILKNETYANAYGNITSSGALALRALDDTTVYERGGVLSYAGGKAGIGGVVYYDYLNKKITAEVKDNTISAGNVTVQATAENSFGGTKKDGVNWDVSEMSTESSDYGEKFEQGSAFKNWNMAYSLAHGDKISAAGSILVRVLDDEVTANVEGINLGKEDNKASSLTIYANDYTIMNMIAGQFSASGEAAAGGNVIVAIGNTKTKALLNGGAQYLSGDLKTEANTEKYARTVLVGGSGSNKVAVNGSAYVNKNNDTIISSIIGSNVFANNVTVNANQKNDSLGVDVSVAGSGKASIGGILYLNLFEDNTKALIGDNGKTRTKITANNNIKVTSDSDYESREYLLSVSASGKIGVSGLGIANVMNSTIESGVYNADITSTNDKLDINAYRGFNKDSSGKTAFFRNWFKDTDAYKNRDKERSNPDPNDENTIKENQISQGDLDKLKDDDESTNLAPIVGALNVSAGGEGAGSGTIIVNKARGSLTSKIDNSTVSTKNGATAMAQQNFTNFDAVAAVAAAKTAAINGVGVINSLEETVTAQINKTTVNSGSITTDAQSNMNLNQLVISGQGAGKGAAIGVVVDSNNINDKVYSYITNTTATEGAEADSAHNIMINNILLAGGGTGQGLSANVAAIVNDFTGETLSKIENSTISGGKITLSSFDNLDNLSAVVGISGAGQGANLSGYAIRNKLDNKSKSFVNASTLDVTESTNIMADSVISSTNAIFSAGIAGQGATVLANVISNTVTSEVEGYISASTIKNEGDIKITANYDNDGNKYRYDEMTNTTGNVSFAGQGAALSTNVIYTNYSNKVKAYVDNTQTDKILDENNNDTGKIRDITLYANSERKLNNTNVGISGAAMGASIGVNAISTNIDTETLSYIDAKSKTMDAIGAINMIARDNTDIENIMGTVQIAGLGAAAGVSLDMTWNNGIAKSEILSATGGQINAKSVSIKSDNILGYDKTNVGVSAGLVGLAGDYVLIKSGKKIIVENDDNGKKVVNEGKSYTESEKDSGINTSISDLGLDYVSNSYTEDLETGAISNVNGNLSASGNISIAANSKIKGIGKDSQGNDNPLNLSNVTVSAGLGAGSVGVKDVDLASNTVASITGGNVESTYGNISLNSKSNSNVKLNNVEVKVAGIEFSGGSAIYNNASNTVAKIGSTDKTTVSAGGDINVVSDSTSKSIIDATFVTVTGGSVVAVDLAENIDKNNSLAVITGETDVNSGGKLTIHSTANTDLQSTKQTVRVSGVDMVRVSKNKVDSSTVGMAIIENVTGNITTHGLDIITDYGIMNTLSKSNVVAVALGGVASVDNSGAYMNSTFKSGIDSPDGLVLTNTGDANIVTAKDNGTKGLVAKSDIYNVKVSIQDFVAVSQAKAENTATSETVLKSNSFTTDNLAINSYLNSTADAEATGTKVAVGISVNSVKASAKDTGTMKIDIAGNNTVNNDAKIKATHSANSHAELSAFNFALLAGGATTDIYTEVKANTTANIGGNFNVASGAIDINTARTSNVSKSSGGGGIIAVNDPDVTNSLTGTSLLNITDLRTDNKKGQNSWKINNKSDNSFEVVSTDGAGGVIAVSSEGTHTTLDTTAETILNSTSLDEKVATNINSDLTVSFNVENNSTISETTSNSGGGIVAVTTNNVDNTYKSNAKLTIKNSKINAKDIELKTKSSLMSKSNDFVQYTGTGGGFVAVNDFNVKNTLTQTSKIDVQNSILRATNNLITKAQTESKFKQKIEANTGGFVTVPRGYNTLTVTNTNQLDVDNKSKLYAGNKLQTDFDSSNTLEVRTNSDARNFAGKPSAYADLKLTVDNKLNNSGNMEAGDLVDINFMKESINTLTQYAYSECHAFAAATNEGGELLKTINNAVSVASGANIISGKDVEVDYSYGGGGNSSYVGWKTVSYGLFGIPIKNSGAKNAFKPSEDNSLTLNGEIIAGQGTSKYMLIDRNGKVNLDKTIGFYEDEYTVSETEKISGTVVKERTLKNLKISIDNIDENLTDIETELSQLDPLISDIKAEKSSAQLGLDTINGILSDGYEMKNSVTDENGKSDFGDIIKNDIDSLIIKHNDEETDRITQDQYDKISNDYSAKLNEVNAYNHGHFDKKEVPTMSTFVDNVANYDLTDSQKDAIDNLTAAQKDTFKVYYGVDNTKIIGSGSDQISQETFDLISGAYNTTLSDIDIYNNGHATKITAPTMKEFVTTNDYGLSSEQITTLSNGYDAVNAKIIVKHEAGATDTNAKYSFTTYENASGKYVSLARPKVTTEIIGGEEVTVKSSDEIAILNNEISNLTEQLKPYTDKKTQAEENKDAYITKRAILQGEYDAVLATDAKQYEKDDTSNYQIVFNDIKPTGYHIWVDGMGNNKISGSGNFNVSQPGVKIDNYSTRTLIFNEIDLSGGSNSGLYIYNRNQFPFFNKPQAVSGLDAYKYIAMNDGAFASLPTDGVHYRDLNGAGAFSGITINNYYDINHPFANTFAEGTDPIPNPTMASDLYIIGNINSSGNLNIWNESGGIFLANKKEIFYDDMSLVAPNGIVSIWIADSTGTPASVNIKNNDSIFAGDAVTILTNGDVNISGTINVGYSDRNITITDDMIKPENLIYDPTSGETNMINLGLEGDNISFYQNNTNGNIKAIYKDGQIYLYNMPCKQGVLGISAKNITSSTTRDKITIADGLKNITINNTTTAQLNIANIENSQNAGYVSAHVIDSGSTITDDDVTINTIDHATTNITSTGKLALNGAIKNNIISNYHDYKRENGILNITAKNGLEVKQATKLVNEVSTDIDSIVSYGTSNITLNGGQGDINGSITSYGITNFVNNGDGNLNIAKNIVNDAVRVYQNPELGEVSVLDGQINISNTSTGTLNISGNIEEKEGDIKISDASQTNIKNTALISNEKGDIQIQSKGLDMEKGASIADDSGNITIISDSYAENSGKTANMVINGDIKNNNGSILIRNNGDSATLGYTETVDEKVVTVGSIVEEQGDLQIVNTKGDMTITSVLSHNKTNPNANGMILIENSSTGRMNVQTEIASYGAGKIDTTDNDIIKAIKITNSANSDALTLSNNISARLGNIYIEDNSVNLLTTNANIFNTENGSIFVDNKNGTANVGGKILTKEGNINIANSGDADAMDINAVITQNKGDVNISSSSGTLNYTGTTTNKEGNTIITSYSGAGNVNVGGHINTQKGNTQITNNGADIQIASTIRNNNGNVSITNTNGALTLASNNDIQNTKGNITISNTGSTADIDGKILAQEGDIEVTNANAGALNFKGDITNENGNIVITSSSEDGMNFKNASVTENKKGNTTITNNKGDLVVENGATIENTGSGDTTLENKGGKFTVSGLIKHISDTIANIFVKNSGNKELEIASTGIIENSNGDIVIENSNSGALEVEGNVTNTKGKTTVTNTSDGGIDIATTGKINNKDGNIEISNTGTNGINVEGSIKADKQNIVITNRDSNVAIGEYTSNNDNYINAVTGNVIVNQTNGNIVNNITDPEASAKHQNNDLGNTNPAYKTLIAAAGDMVLNVTDGDVGSYSNTSIPAGKSIDANTRDYTESINVNIGGNVTIKAINDTKTDARLVNLRAKESDLIIKSIESDGNILLTATDWKQADTRPTPKDNEYFTGYSILSSAEGSNPTLKGQNISVISSNNIGADGKKLRYLQDLSLNPNATVSFEAENDLSISGKSTGKETKIYQILTKRGSIDFDMESDADIKEITAGKGLRLTQKAQNLTVRNLGMPVNPEGESSNFADILNPHDDLVYGPSPVTPEKTVIPNYVIIRVLDAVDTPNRADSNLYIYSADVKGNQGENTQYYPDGSKLADVTLMADNIYAASYKAPDSTVSTKTNPNGVKIGGGTYTNTDLDPTDTNVYEMRGVNAFGDGEALTFDILGVDVDVVNNIVENPMRNDYIVQYSNTSAEIFKNNYDRTVYYGYDFKADNVYLSANDYVTTDRGVVLETIYADNAYVNTHDTNLSVEDGDINNYSELRNKDKIAVVDNDFRRIVKPANVQLYTQKTGSFALGLNETINMTTTAPTVYNNPHMLVNGYHSEWSFVNKGQKESKAHYENTKMPTNIDKNNYNEPQKRISERFDTTKDTGLNSNYEILDISTTGASVKNDKKLKRGKKTTITFKFDDVDITVNAKVVKVEGDKVGLEFIDMPREVANKILYRYMQRADSMKSNLMTLSL